MPKYINPIFDIPTKTIITNKDFNQSLKSVEIPDYVPHL